MEKVMASGAWDRDTPRPLPCTFPSLSRPLSLIPPPSPLPSHSPCPLFPSLYSSLSPGNGNALSRQQQGLPLMSSVAVLPGSLTSRAPGRVDQRLCSLGSPYPLAFS